MDLRGFINDLCLRQAALNQEDQFETLSKTLQKVTEFFCQEISRAGISKTYI